MIDITQALLIVVITILTVLLTLIGTQIYNLLKELRVSISKINKILDDSSVVSGTVAKEVTGVSEIIEGISSGLSIFSFLRRRKHV